MGKATLCNHLGKHIVILIVNLQVIVAQVLLQVDSRAQPAEACADADDPDMPASVDGLLEQWRCPCKVNLGRPGVVSSYS